MTGRSILRPAALGLSPAAAHAQMYPTKPIRRSVIHGAGGTADILARVTGERLSETMGQQIVVENRPGAGGTIRTGVAAKAGSDGYTVYQAAFGPLAISPAAYGRDAEGDPSQAQRRSECSTCRT